VRKARFSSKLKKARQKSGMTQKQLAEMLYVDPSLVCRWEKGQRQIPLATWVQIMDILGTRESKSRRKNENNN
jgi:transcriptional regulator with XRE-family HTH domain